MAGAGSGGGRAIFTQIKSWIVSHIVWCAWCGRALRFRREARRGKDGMCRRCADKMWADAQRRRFLRELGERQK